MARRVELPDAARCVVVGGGVGGTSIAYHLAQLGWDDVVLLERSQLTSGSTFHSAGLVGQLRGSVSLTKMMMYSVELYRRLGEESEFDPGWTECGSLRLASSEERMEELRRQAGWAKTFGLPMDLVSAEEAKEKFPLMSTDGVLGAAWIPTDGYLDPAQLTNALADGARRGGCQVFTNTRVTGIDVADGRVRGVSTDRGDIAAEVVVNAGGMYAAEIGRMAGVRIPVIPMSHQYLITQPFRERGEDHLPTLRDPDLLIYFREEGQGLVMGGYERQSKPAFLPHGTSGLDQIPPDFNGRLLEDDWDRFAEITENSKRRVPVMDEVGDHAADQRPGGLHSRQRVLPGGDGGRGALRRRLLLRPRTGGRGRRRQGDGGVDHRGRAEPRPLGDGHQALRLAVPLARLHARPHQGDLRDLLRHPLSEPRARGRAPAAGLARQPPGTREHGAAFGEKSGWERVNWYESNAEAGDESLRPAGWAGQHWSPAIGAEHRATREGVAIFDETSFAKMEIEGPGAAERGRAALRQQGRARGRASSPIRRCSTRAAGSSATSPWAGSPRTASRSSPAPPSAITTASGSASTCRHDGSVQVHDTTSQLGLLRDLGPPGPGGAAAADARRASPTRTSPT